MSTLIEKVEYKGYEIQVHYDEIGSDSPRDWDNLGTMVCFHSRYNLGDKHDHTGIEDFLTSVLHEFYSYEYVESLEYKGLDSLWKVFEKHHIVLPLYLYDHSGITMNTTGFSCPWDSGQVGIIYVSKEKAKKEYSWKNLTQSRIKKICEYLKGEVETYDTFLRGEVYGFIIEKDGEHIDSCWGFYGNYEKYMIPECKSIIDSEIKHRIKKHIEKVKGWIKNHVPLHYRTPLTI